MKNNAMNRKSHFKTLIRAAAFLMAFAFILCCAACKKHGGDDDSTELPVIFERGYLGDWYGIMYIPYAGGRYSENGGLTDDCVMRITPGENGVGSAYLVVNGVGEFFDGGFALVESFEDCISFKGQVGGNEAQWNFTRMGDKISAAETLGEGDDFMRIEFVLGHCGAEWSGDRIPAGYEYTRERGFGGVVAEMGGDESKLAALTDPSLNDRLTSDRPGDPFVIPTPEPHNFDDEGRTISANGKFSVILPEGYEIVTDDEQDFILANPEQGIEAVRFSIIRSVDDPMSKAVNAAGASFTGTVYHFDIDGFDSYVCAARRTDGGEGSEIVLYGVNEEGKMLHVSYVMNAELLSAVRLLDAPSSDFTELVLGLLVNP